MVYSVNHMYSLIFDIKSPSIILLSKNEYRLLLLSLLNNKLTKSLLIISQPPHFPIHYHPSTQPSPTPPSSAYILCTLYTAYPSTSRMWLSYIKQIPSSTLIIRSSTTLPATCPQLVPRYLQWFALQP